MSSVWKICSHDAREFLNSRCNDTLLSVWESVITTCSVKTRRLIEVKIRLVPRSSLLRNGLWYVGSTVVCCKRLEVSVASCRHNINCACIYLRYLSKNVMITVLEIGNILFELHLNQGFVTGHNLQFQRADRRTRPNTVNWGEVHSKVNFVPNTQEQSSNFDASVRKASSTLSWLSLDSAGWHRVARLPDNRTDVLKRENCQCPYRESNSGRPFGFIHETS
jgi:hypothetical protein